MCIQTHVGTSFVRRALAQINCLPIISGNIGAFRKIALIQSVAGPENEIVLSEDSNWPENIPGPFRHGFIGEDLELTWRVHRAGYRVEFAPQAIVLAEVPSTLKALWRQRVRWARGLLQTVSLHKTMFFNFRYGLIGLYLPLNFFNQVITPMLQLILLALFIFLALSGHSPIQFTLVNFLLWFGLITAVFTTILAVILDKAWKDLIYLYILPLWVPYSLFMNAVMIWAIILEIRGTQANWNKLERTGVVSRKEM
jgi:cellulose synthase/poly-beta-1,6-N-acetylglucosamine synthase-like glycosyltransferase